MLLNEGIWEAWGCQAYTVAAGWSLRLSFGVCDMGCSVQSLGVQDRVLELQRLGLGLRVLG